jgi:hypothetical protein
MPGSPLICTADKSKSVKSQARAGLAREGLENELLKSRHPSQGEEPNPPPRRHKGPRDALRTGAHLFCDGLDPVNQ